jgi:hypothetical protein
MLAAWYVCRPLSPPICRHASLDTTSALSNSNKFIIWNFFLLNFFLFFSFNFAETMNPSAAGTTTVVSTTLPYVAAVYSNAAPPPAAPVLELLPWERKSQKEAERKQADAIAKQKHEESVAKSRAKGGLFSQLTAVAKDVSYFTVNAVESGVKETKKAVNNELDSRAESRFHAHFASLKAEKLLWSTSGKIISGGAPIDGELFITAHFLTFAGYYSDTKSKPGDTLRRAVNMCVPIASIISIQLALASWPANTPPTAAPQVAPLQPGQVGNSLMVFCSDRSLHLLYQFTQLK